ncbi:alpha-glucosidase [Spirochaetota bacterium]
MENKWWKNKVVYQIYPQSFYDYQNNGIGNLKGIIQKLDYLKKLGIEMVWISSFYKSPMVDNGYDVSDYYAINSQYGSIADFEDLINEAKKRNIHILLDLVVNHCSDQHEWFQKALKDPLGFYGDYFIIKKGTGSRPPNNWRGIFGGSVWEPIEGTDLYYYHTFTKEQPDLNWENKNLRNEIYKIINFWLEKGIAGFRLDAISFIKKNPSYESFNADRPDGLVALRTVSINYPGIEVFLKELKEKTFDRFNAFTVAEMSALKPESFSKFIGNEGLFTSVFDFGFMNADLKNSTLWYKHNSFSALDVALPLFKSQEAAQQCDGSLAIALENHDQPRSLNKWFGSTTFSFEQAAFLAVLNLSLRGIPFLFQGQEIGMTNVDWDTVSEIRDAKSLSQYEQAITDGIDPREAFKAIAYRSRDNARSPMQWNDQPYAGFSKNMPWTKVNSNYQSINVQKQESDPDSLLSFYKALIQLRCKSKYSRVFTEGSLVQIFKDKQNLIAFERIYQTQKIHVLLNYSNNDEKIVCDKKPFYVLGNYRSMLYEKDILRLRPFEALIFEVF